MREHSDQNTFDEEEPGRPEERESRSPGRENEPGSPQPSGRGWGGTGTEPGGDPYQNKSGAYRQPPDSEYGAPYQQGYQNNIYPPSRAPGGYGTRDSRGYPPARPPSYNPYQYNANSGWQQQHFRQQEKYEWKFEDYEKLDRKRSGTRKRQNRGVVVFTVLILCVLSAGLIGVAGFSIYTAATEVVEEDVERGDRVESVAQGEEQLVITSRPEINETRPVEGKLSIPQVAESVLPSVVGVIVYSNDQYFESSGYGSGIVMSADGYIITNAHVVAGGTGFKVQFTDGDAYDADMIGYDLMTDLAVLKIDAQDLVPAQFGDSDALRVGETVVAVGNPGGDVLASSVTSGIISAVNREVYTTNYNYKMTYIQTDAAINPGNSGGALANEYGQVIGINSSKIVAAGYEGIGFAIPIASAKPVIDDLIANGKVTGRVMLGITCRPVDEVDARNYGIQMGLMIETVDPSSDLTAAGVLKGDILTHIDGERIYTLNDVRDILDRHKQGDTVTLTFYRRIGTREETYEARTRLMESQ